MAVAKSAPRPVAQGTLQEKPLVHLLVYLEKNRMTGTLAIFSDTATPGEQSEQDRIYFEEGRPAAARLARPAESLEQGLLSLFDQRRSAFGFYEDDLLGSREKRLTGDVDPLALIARSLRQTAREDVVRRVLKKIGSSRLQLLPQAELHRFGLQPEEQALIELLQAEPGEVEALARNTDLPREMAERLIYLLAITKSVVIYEQEDPENAGAEETNRSSGVRTVGAAARPETPAKAVAAASEGAGLAIDPGAAGSNRTAVVASRPTEASPVALAGMGAAVADPGLPQVPASGKGPEQAEQQQPTATQPSVAASEGAEPAIDPGAAGSNRTATVASRPAEAAPVAAAGMGAAVADPGLPQVSANGRGPEQAEQQQPTAAQPSAAAGRDDSVPPPPRELSAEISTRWMEILKRSGDIDNQTYFQVLNVSRDADPAEVKAAYFELVKRWHPDRLPSELLPLKDRVQRVFHYMSQAHEHLTDKEKRIEYLRNVDDGGGTVAADRELKRKLDAAMEFIKADVLIKRQRFEQALELVDRVLQADDEEPTYHATRALILMNKHLGKDAPFTDILRSIDRALELDPSYGDALFYRGQVLRRMGLKEEAIEEFKRVLNINPKHIAAQREVRIDTIRRSSSSRRSRVSSLVSLVFGKKEK